MPPIHLLTPTQSWYIHTEPLHSALTFSTALSVLTFVLGELTNNSSTVDRLWAWLPILYSAHFALHPHWAGAGSVTKLFSWSGALSPWQAIVPNGVDERMFLVLILQVRVVVGIAQAVRPVELI